MTYIRMAISNLAISNIASPSRNPLPLPVTYYFVSPLMTNTKLCLVKLRILTLTLVNE